MFQLDSKTKTRLLHNWIFQKNFELEQSIQFQNQVEIMDLSESQFRDLGLDRIPFLLWKEKILHYWMFYGLS